MHISKMLLTSRLWSEPLKFGKISKITCKGFPLKSHFGSYEPNSCKQASSKILLLSQADLKNLQLNLNSSRAELGSITDKRCLLKILLKKIIYDFIKCKVQFCYDSIKCTVLSLDENHYKIKDTFSS